MAVGPSHQCPAPGCHATLAVGVRYCSTHADRSLEYRLQDQRRGSSQARGYDARWHALSKSWRARHPLCRCGQPGQLVHHIVEPRGNVALMLDERNLLTLCEACHSREHQRRRQAGVQGHRAPGVAG